MRKKKRPNGCNRIHDCRMGVQQKDIAFLMEKDSTQISKWERGHRIPGVDNAMGLAVATGRLTQELFFDYHLEWKKKIEKRKKLLSRKKVL